ncbi:UNVERIFIED_CONTAM: hypothetical protein Slati_4540000 [Sesamum latifolium]|uniref:Reverse transcriptase domain-containing protein n=1 Tax=Sesamum latifolium TaxID=2727402 RepID=A0AAW2S1X5_9LAMI
MRAPQRAVRSIPAPLARPAIATPCVPTATAPTARVHPIYVGNIPLTPSSLPVDAIADAFHNSSRKILSYVPPTVQNGEVIVRPSLDIIRSGSQRWSNTAVGYFLGRRPYFHHVNEFVRSVWPMKWEPGMVLRKLQHTQVPVWIKLRHLPVELWTTEGLSTVASGIGKPLYPDAITRACTRLDFTRVCIMLDIQKHIVIMVPREDGGETPCKVDVEYEWLPPKCTACMTLGHSAKGCPTQKPRQPPVSVYVQKPGTGVRGQERNQRQPLPLATAAAPVVGSNSVEREDKGKAIVLYNAFEVLMESDSTTDDSKDFNLLVYWKRVSVGNVARVQRGLLPRWSWFVEYVSPGSRIWLAWDEDFIDLNVVESGDQFIHCSAHIRSLHIHVLITVVYGVNDVMGRRVLWDDLNRISHTVHDVPWLWVGILTRWWMSARDTQSLWKRLDRLLVNDCWLGSWPNTYYESLHARTSDHSPLVLRCDNLRQSIGMFRFDNYLTLSSEFIPSVQRIWQHHIVGTTMFAVTRKLKALKPVFRAQRQNRGDLSNNVKLAAGFLEVAQHLLTQDRHCGVLLHLEFCCKLVLRLAARLEQIMLHQRAKMAWMKGGDQCSRVFFRKIAKPFLQEGLSDYGFGGPEEEARSLLLPVTASEIKQAVLILMRLKHRGLMGIPRVSFKAAWPIGGEVTKAIMDFFVTGRLLKQVNSTLISLIPKRMRGILDMLVSPSQNAFVPGRSIGDNILLAQELFYGYNQQRLPPRCALKVDLRKAYDTVEWDFLRAVLTLFGFPEHSLGGSWSVSLLRHSRSV